MRVTFNGKPAVAIYNGVGDFNIVPIKLDTEFRTKILQFSHNSTNESLCAISVELEKGEDLFTGTEVGNILKEKQDEIAELHSIIRQSSAMGFYTISSDSGTMHKQLCNQVKKLLV